MNNENKSEQELIEEQRTQLAIEQERVKTLHQFINRATHDLMTPLSVIKASLYLARKIRDEEKQTSKFDIIDSRSRYCCR